MHVYIQQREKKMLMNSISNYPLALFILQLFLSRKVFFLFFLLLLMLRVLEPSVELCLILQSDAIAPFVHVREDFDLVCIV